MSVLESTASGGGWRATALGVYVNTVTWPAGWGLPWAAPAHGADAHQPITHLCTSVLYRNFMGHLPLCKDGLVIYCTVLESVASAKSQPPWKAAKKFQQCESRNKLGTSITIAAITRISPTIFPPMCELFFTHAMGHRKALYLPWIWPAGCTPSLFPAWEPKGIPWVLGTQDTRGATPCRFSQASFKVLPSASYKLWPLQKLFFLLNSTVLILCF